MLKWERDELKGFIYDEAHFGDNKITVVKYRNSPELRMWFHIGETWILDKEIEATNLDDARAEAVSIVREYLNEKISYWMDLFHDLWKADQWLDEEDDE